MRKKSRSEIVTPKNPPKNPHQIARQLEGEEKERERFKQKTGGTPEQVRARLLVKSAVRNGEISAQDCERGWKGCVKWPTEAHHLSYEPGEELNIVWLCKPCHDRLSSKEWRKKWGEKNKTFIYRVKKNKSTIVIK